MLSINTSTSLVHAYLLTTAMIVNEPLVAHSQSKVLSAIFGHLNQEELIDNENIVYGYEGAYGEFSKEFFETMTYYEQNEVLMLERRATQQSIWVKVEVPKGDAHGNAKVAEELKRAEKIEAEMLEKMSKAAKIFREVYQTFKAKKKVGLKKNVVSLEDRLLVHAVTILHKSATIFAYQNLNLLN